MFPIRRLPRDNNAAERSLRHLVISRKISGGARSGAGSGSKTTMASLFGTWRAQGSQSPPGMPQAAGFPSTLNCYNRPAKTQCPSQACPRAFKVRDVEDDLPEHDAPDGRKCYYVGQGLFLKWL